MNNSESTDDKEDIPLTFSIERLLKRSPARKRKFGENISSRAQQQPLAAPLEIEASGEYGKRL